MDLDVAYVSTLARTLGALLPHRVIGQQTTDPVWEVFPLMQRLEAACYTAGLHAQDAVVIADALGSSLCGGSGRFEPLAAEVARAKAVLYLVASGEGDGELQAMPEGTELQDQTIAQFLAWRLLVELPEDEPKEF